MGENNGMILIMAVVSVIAIAVFVMFQIGILDNFLPSIFDKITEAFN